MLVREFLTFLGVSLATLLFMGWKPMLLNSIPILGPDFLSQLPLEKPSHGKFGVVGEAMMLLPKREK